MMLTIVTPADDRNLLSIEQLRVAAGFASGDASNDMDLARIGLGVSDRIARECGIAGDGVRPPTLKRETVEQTFRLSCPVSLLLLARRFVSGVTSVSIDGEAAATSDYELDASAGMLRRLRESRPAMWQPATVVITYAAGFDDVPGDLVLAASVAVQEQWSATQRDPLLKRDRVDGIGEQEFWVGGIGGAAPSAFSSTVQALLEPFRTMWVS
ncbi:hypothetical protein [Ancylobacter mangrovi]|uniref:hypothetical protein n=1 Tax=Ancylobacter mangrovi TaxID=2972472 RepID=UPI0021623070|nr:hypothetical protein [Ancylobacter mangrovi]MCS0501617.1 hypothetical protein [Ancylobacter mangrovi]